MTAFNVVALLGGGVFVVFALYNAAVGQSSKGSNWMIPAFFGALFLAWSLFAVSTEGVLGFWPEHNGNAWENQIWFDLLLAAAVALTFLVPEAKRLGMRVLLWSAFVICSGSIGLLAMTARIFYLRSKAK
ncbi:MAG: DUF2834 domain-containing protein [Pseudomonadota bacterium]